ncbi:fungal-specific transcription factor domain-containing protein [Stachybotrys elegans]|uniref:Fungal-specific transcription factor domain-containing protein n=1 Tax=Stachybotrys elegans TaxID=80388 RepID=A0A8K0SIW5_9HYPO|nr:fungal-specific transcription factor domain-containing protein [Stachybotrys elegans]
MSSRSNSPERYPRFRPSCAACHRMKKKCDRKLPKCSLCQRYQRDCSYSFLPTQETPPSGGTSVLDSSTSSVTNTTDHDFPAVYFLDSALFRRSVCQLPHPAISIDPTVQAFINAGGFERRFISNFFNLIHPWFPFLSRRLFMERVISPLGPVRPENTLLIAAMKLVADPKPDMGPRTAAYKAIKSGLFQAELSGLVDFKIFQALVLLSLYEIGHAILPDAYMTVGYCLRYGSVLGLGRSVQGDSKDTIGDVDQEERRRAWWAILLLDRLVNLGCAERMPFFEDLGTTVLLPADDSVWESTNHSRLQAHRLTDPPNATMGRFCLTAQAALLFGRVFRAIQEPHGASGARPLEEKLLDDTLSTLTNVSLQEGQLRGIGVCSPTTICYSARFLLNDRERHQIEDDDGRSSPEFAPAEFEFTASFNMLQLAQGIVATRKCGDEEVSPFCMDAMYRSGIFYARHHSQTGDQSSLEALHDIEKGFKIMSGRWRSAEYYLSMMNARVVSGIL